MEGVDGGRGWREEKTFSKPSRLMMNQVFINFGFLDDSILLARPFWQGGSLVAAEASKSSWYRRPGDPESVGRQTSVGCPMFLLSWWYGRRTTIFSVWRCIERCWVDVCR